MYYLVPSQEFARLPTPHSHRRSYQFADDDLFLSDSAPLLSTQRDRYLDAINERRRLEEDLYAYPDVGYGRSSLIYADELDDGRDYLYEAQLQARARQIQRQRQAAIHQARQREQQRIALALRQQEEDRQLRLLAQDRRLRLLERERKQQALLAHQAKLLEQQKQMKLGASHAQAQALKEQEAKQQMQLVASIFAALLGGSEISRMSEYPYQSPADTGAQTPAQSTQDPALMPVPSTKPSCAKCQCQSTSNAAAVTSKAESKPEAPKQGPSFHNDISGFLAPFLQGPSDLQAFINQAQELGGLFGLPSNQAPSEPAVQDESNLADPARRRSLDHLGMIRAEFDMARMAHESSAASSPTAEGHSYEEKLIQMLERLDGVESEGDESVRTIRRTLARDLSFALDGLEESRKKEEVKTDAPVNVEKKVHFEEEKADDLYVAAEAAPVADESKTNDSIHANDSVHSDVSHTVDPVQVAVDPLPAADESTPAPTVEEHVFPPVPSHNPSQLPATETEDVHSVSSESSIETEVEAEAEANLKDAIALSLASSDEAAHTTHSLIKRRHTIDAIPEDTVIIGSDGESEGSVKGYEVL